MRTLIVAFVALIACMSVASCCSTSVSPISATKSVLDDKTTDNPSTGDGSDNPSEPEYIFYDSEGDDFD